MAFSAEECVPTQAVAEARRRVVGGSALPAAELKQYKDLAALNSAMVAILDEYRQAFPYTVRTIERSLRRSTASFCLRAMPCGLKEMVTRDG